MEVKIDGYDHSVLMSPMCHRESFAASEAVDTVLFLTTSGGPGAFFFKYKTNAWARPVKLILPNALAPPSRPGRTEYRYGLILIFPI